MAARARMAFFSALLGTALLASCELFAPSVDDVYGGADAGGDARPQDATADALDAAGDALPADAAADVPVDTAPACVSPEDAATEAGISCATGPTPLYCERACGTQDYYGSCASCWPNGGGPCVRDSQCCAGFCNSQGTCGHLVTCTNAGIACSTPGECCSGTCRASYFLDGGLSCQTCITGAQPCSADPDCCSENCVGPDGGAVCKSCLPLGEPCTRGRNCCSGRCGATGKCLNCMAAGASPCCNAEDCCSGSCTAGRCD